MPANDNHFFMMDEDAFSYINLGTDAVPAWTLMNFAEEFNIDMSKAEIDLPAGISGFKLGRGGDFEAPVAFKYSRPNPGITDAVWDKLVDSFINKRPVQFGWTDLAMTDANAFGFKAWCEVMKLPFKKVNDESQALDIEAKPTDYYEDGQGVGGLVLPEFIGAPAA